MTDIAAFLTARLDETEVRVHNDIEWWWGDRQQVEVHTDSGILTGAEGYIEPFIDPAQLLREVEAKRRLVGVHEHAAATENAAQPGDFGCQTCHYDRGDCVLLGFGWCDTLRIMAAPYADHPDYDPAWRVA
jgi:hypothetical protein